MEPYEFNTRAYETSRTLHGDIRIKKVIELVGTVGTLLDIGCLDGTVGELFIKNGNIVYGVNASMIEIPVARTRGLLAKLEEPLDLSDNTFDCVFAGEVIEHVFNSDLLLSEVRRILKPHGSFVLTTPTSRRSVAVSSFCSI